MAEKVARLGIMREKDFMYFVKNGAVWKVPRKRPGVPKGRQEKVQEGGFDQSNDFIYFLDKDGDVSRSPRAVGGQKRAKKATKRVAKKPAKKAAKKAKKPVKKAAKKPAKKPAKKAKRR
jgi:hypothetical protein